MNRNIVHEWVIATRHAVPFFQREPRQKKQKILTPNLSSFGRPSGKSGITSFNELRLISLTRRIRAAVDSAVTKNEKVAFLQKQIEALREVRKTTQKTPTSAPEIYRSMAKTGKSITYYEAETKALCSDLEYVAASHNLELFTAEIERVKEKIAQEILEQVAASVALSAEEEKRLSHNLGLKIYTSEKQVKEMPVKAANKYIVRVTLFIRDEDELDPPDPEIMAFFEEEQARWEANGNGKRGNSGGQKAKLAAGEMLQAGMKILRTYGSKGDKEEDD